MQIVIYNLYSKLSSSPEELQKELSTYAPGYQFTKLFQRKLWNGKVQMLDEQGVFLTGMLPRILKLIKGPVYIQDRRNATTHVMYPPTVKLRDYQIETAYKVLANTLEGTWWPRGVIKIATGGGKTELAAALIQIFNKPTVFIVDTKDLLWQAHDRFKKYNIPVGIIGDGKYKLNKVVVCTVQTLNRLFNNNPEKLKFCSKIEQVFFDEAHLIAANVSKGNIFVDVANLFKNAHIRWGLTATPFMKDAYSNWLLEGVTGTQLVEITNRELIDAGWLAEGNVSMYVVPKDDYITQSWPECYDEAIVAYGKRNDKIVEQIKNRPSPVLVLVQREGHGNLLKEMCAEAGLEIPFIFRTHTSKERRAAAKALTSGEIPAVIASKIWDKGIDLPEIKTLILAGGGKSLVSNLQRLGRGLRIADGKATVDIVDFYDESTKWLRDHSNKRKNLWINEGFKVELKEL